MTHIIDVTVRCPVFDSFRVQQVAGMFDVPLSERASERFRVEAPGLDEPWTIGLIVGPSGSGKSTVAREMFGDRLYRRQDWPEDRAVVDCLDDRPIKEITRLFTAVGFSSAPGWVKPYRVLSNGEQFRCDLARALAEGSRELGDGSREMGDGGRELGDGSWELGDGSRELGDGGREMGDGGREMGDGGREMGDGSGEAGAASREPTRTRVTPDSRLPTPNSLVVFDEFTSVVDRNVARAVSAAIAKGIRQGQIPCRFVAVTCHYDVTPWLQPDWIIDMASSVLERRLLRPPRPPVELEIFRCGRSAWKLFARHHYLSGSLSAAARCYLVLWEGNPVAFCATVSVVGRRNHRRVSRLVTLPDYQGLGIGMSVLEAVADLHRCEGHRINITASHPAVITHCRRSPRWRAVSVRKTGAARMRGFVQNYRASTGRAVVSFEYMGNGEGRQRDV